MKLIGNYLSPYVRRVAISLNALDMAFELHDVRVFDAPDEVREYNPVVRIPTLVLDDGTVMIESYAMLDEIDQIAGPQRALTPASGEQRRGIMQVTAFAVSAMEKAQWAFYEGRFRPAEKIEDSWIAHNDAQTLAALGVLDGLAHDAGTTGWLGGSDKLTQADISSVVAFGFAETVRPDLNVAREVPHLAGHAARCEALPVFASAPLP